MNPFSFIGIFLYTIGRYTSDFYQKLKLLRINFTLYHCQFNRSERLVSTPGQIAVPYLASCDCCHCASKCSQNNIESCKGKAVDCAMTMNECNLWKGSENINPRALVHLLLQASCYTSWNKLCSLGRWETHIRHGWLSVLLQGVWALEQKSCVLGPSTE